MSRGPSVWPAAALSAGFGFLSMGFQLVGSRLLAPYFGSSILVWAVLISTFLAAFACGSFTGGVLSRHWPNLRVRVAAAVFGTGLAGLAFTAFAGKALLGVLIGIFEALIPGLAVACLTLFFVPVVALSAVNPLLIEVLSHGTGRAGFVSGSLFAISTAGNIAGVLGTAFLLIPNVGTAALLAGWTIVAGALYALLATYLQAVRPQP
ncbi:MAG: fused MFS/spermidine synthase [Pseudomonadota bacterium]